MLLQYAIFTIAWRNEIFESWAVCQNELINCFRPLQHFANRRRKVSHDAFIHSAPNGAKLLLFIVIHLRSTFFRFATDAQWWQI